MRIAGLISGGKDSSYAHWLVSKNGHKIAKLVAIIPKREDSWMFHYTNPKIMDLYSEAAGIPIVKKHTTGEKEKELEDLKKVLEKLSIDGVVSGAVASNYQKNRIEKICEELEITSLTPLWKKDPYKLLKNMIGEGFKIIITSISAKGLEKEWLGREITKKSLEELKTLNQKHGIHITGEGGEYETLVLDTPFFEKKINLTKTEKTWNGLRGKMRIKQAELVKK